MTVYNSVLSDEQGLSLQLNCNAYAERVGHVLLSYIVNVHVDMKFEERLYEL